MIVKIMTYFISNIIEVFNFNENLIVWWLRAHSGAMLFSEKKLTLHHPNINLDISIANNQ